MDWLAFAGSIIGGLIGGLFTFIGVKLTLSHEDKKKMEEELRKAIDARPRLELDSFKNFEESNVDDDADLNALLLHIEDVNVDSRRISFAYDKKALDTKNLICVEYTFRNTGLTEIDDVAVVSCLPKDTAALDMSEREFFINKKCLNYSVWSKKRFIKNNDMIKIKVYYLKDKVITGLISCSCAIYMRDINGRYWHQPLFAPSNETDNSTHCLFKDFKDATDIDIAIKCFRGELPW